MFTIKDDSGQIISNDKLNHGSILLIDPNGDEVPITNLKFNKPYKTMNATYNSQTGKWLFSPPVSTSEYSGEVPGDLMVGGYQLVVEYDTETLDKWWDFRGKVVLPYVESEHIKAKLDKEGNLFARWRITRELILAAPESDKSARVFFDAYDKFGNITGTVYLASPFHMGNAMLPKDVVDWLRSIGKIYKLGIQLRTNDNCNRSYSDVVPISLKSTPPRCDGKDKRSDRK
jgi:hypothetical protein